ncbi:MAG: hypothetical protein ACO2Y5_07925 [Nitrosopumilaceae archaeon]
MKEYNDSIPYWNENTPQQLTVSQTVEVVQDVSKNIRDHAIQIREIMKTLRQSGAISEVVLAIRESSFAVRDTVRDINETTKELKNNGTINETANAVENTVQNVEQSITTVKEITNDVRRVTPQTSKAVKQGIDSITKETSHIGGKMMQGIKDKVGV